MLDRGAAAPPDLTPVHEVPKVLDPTDVAATCVAPKDADLKHADLKHADLKDADLKDADPKHVDPKDVDLKDVDLKDVDLMDVDKSVRRSKSRLLTRTVVPSRSIGGLVGVL